MATKFTLFSCVFYGMVLLLVVLVFRDCEGTVTAGEAERYQEQQREVAASVPLAQNAELVEERYSTCIGTRRYESVCALMLRFETTGPLISARDLLDQHFTSEGWAVSSSSEKSVYYSRGDMNVQLFLDANTRNCPDAAVYAESRRQCEAAAVRAYNGSQQPYSLTIRSRGGLLVPVPVFWGAFIFVIVAGPILAVWLITWVPFVLVQALGEHLWPPVGE